MNKLVAITYALTPILAIIFAFVLLYNSITGWGWFLFLAFLTSGGARDLLHLMSINGESKGKNDTSEKKSETKF